MERFARDFTKNYEEFYEDAALQKHLEDRITVDDGLFYENDRATHYGFSFYDTSTELLIS